MENKKKCPLCGAPECSIELYSWNNDDIGGNSSIKNIDADKIVCKQGLTFIVHEDVDYGSSSDVRKRYNMIRSILLRTPTKNINGFEYPYKFFYEENSTGCPISDPRKINLANNMRDYPDNIVSRIETVLVNLSKVYPAVGQRIPRDIVDSTLFYCESNNIVEEISGMISFLQELGYLNQETSLSDYTITATGWKKIFDLLKQAEEINQGFIAMSFAHETKPIFDIFYSVIDDCGYYPQRIDLKEHNNQIVPEIFYEISRSKFLVVDVTYPNYGAYYEAGYGEALKKQVIVCCRKDVFESKDKPHFDIAQKSAVIWTDEEDLRKRLTKRIEATVGRRKKTST